MKRQIRTAMFESNSSSCHTLHICSKDEFEKWKNGEVVYDEWNEVFATINNIQVKKKDLKEFYSYRYEGNPFMKQFSELDEKALDQLKTEYIEFNDLQPEGKTYNEWNADYDLETYTKSYTSEHGDEIVIFGKYGYDG